MIVFILAFSLVIVYETSLNQRARNSIQTLSSDDLTQMSSPPPGVTLENQVIYINSSATIPVELGPMNANMSMYSFSIFGEINPILEVKQRIDVRFVAINVDTDAYHNFVITTEGPPYYNSYGGMMSDQYGNNYSYGGMMNGFYGLNNSYGYMMGYLPPQSSGRFAFVNVSYDFSSNGTYWYLCTYPGHAAEGMYGEIVVT